MASEHKLRDLIEALAAEGLDSESLGDLEARWIGDIGRLRIKRDRYIRDREAARLLPLGRDVAAECLHVAPSTVYKMTHRHLRRSRSTVG